MKDDFWFFVQNFIFCGAGCSFWYLFSHFLNYKGKIYKKKIKEASATKMVRKRKGKREEKE